MTIPSLILAFSAGIGLFLIARRLPPLAVNRSIDEGLIILAATLIGARLDFTLQHAAYYRVHLAEAFAFWQGGLGWLGALMAGLIALVIIAAINHDPILTYADRFLPLLPALAVGSWLASWATVGGGLNAGIPHQLTAALATLAGFLTLGILLPKSLPSGSHAIAGGALFALLQLAFDFQRADSPRLWASWPLERWAAVGLLAISVGLLAWRLLSVRRQKPVT